MTKWKDFPGDPVVETLPSSAGAAGCIPGQGTKIPHALGPKKQNIKQKQYSHKFNNDFKNGPHQKILKEMHVTKWKSFYTCVTDK